MSKKYEIVSRPDTVNSIKGIVSTRWLFVGRPIILDSVLSIWVLIVLNFWPFLIMKYLVDLSDTTIPFRSLFRKPPINLKNYPNTAVILIIDLKKTQP